MTRTTLILDDACMNAVRDLARRERRTLSDVVNQLLREGVQRRKKPLRPPFALPAFAMGRPRVNLGDRDALEGLMDS